MVLAHAGDPAERQCPGTPNNQEAGVTALAVGHACTPQTGRTPDGSAKDRCRAASDARAFPPGVRCPTPPHVSRHSPRRGDGHTACWPCCSCCSRAAACARAPPAGCVTRSAPRRAFATCAFRARGTPRTAATPGPTEVVLRNHRARVQPQPCPPRRTGAPSQFPPRIPPRRTSAPSQFRPRNPPPRSHRPGRARSPTNLATSKATHRRGS